MMDDYRIVVPSRKRPELMQRLLALVPTATVTVEDNEMVEYGKYVPPAQLVAHPPLGNIARIRNWIMDTFTEPCIIQMDDDFELMKCLGGAMRSLRQADDILRVIENQVQVATDLNIGIFGWYPSLPMVGDYFARDPFAFSKPCIGVFGCRGSARHRRFDPKSLGREDMDWTLQAVRDDRIVLCDCRYHASVGTNEKHEGGTLGLINEKMRLAATDYLRIKWGPIIELRKAGEKQMMGRAVSRRQ